MILDEGLLNTLKTCPKSVDKIEPREEKSQHNHKQQTIKVSWGGFLFEIYTRKNEDLPFNFSAGLLWKSPEWTVCLCRYNGDHGSHRNPDKTIVERYHKHQYRIIDKEAWLGDDVYAEETTQYNSLETAVYQLCLDYNIDYWDKIPYLPQRWNLFDFEKEDDEWSTAPWIA